MTARDANENLNGSRTIAVGDTDVGGNRLTVIAGPCSIESAGQMDAAARAVAGAGAQFLRGGAFKPRTSPHTFQGLGKEGLPIIRDAADRYGLGVITEVLSPERVEVVGEYTDIFQVGARNMQNYPLLRELGRTDDPVLMKRSFAAPYREFLKSVDYLLEGGNDRVMLCERGIRTFETRTRFTPDLAAVPVLQEMSPFPVFVDPSHGTGDRSLVAPLARAAVAAGADGLMVEVHPDPENARSDAEQQITCKQFENLMTSLLKLREALPNGDGNST